MVHSTSSLIQVYLSLGGNENNPLLTIKKALSCISSHPHIFHLTFSHFYCTQPVEVSDSDTWFINAVCTFQTALSLKEVTTLTQKTERQLGKNDKPKNASRPIDIDILFYGSSTSQDSTITIPHPKWQERLFVLIPLSDLTNKVTVQFIDGKREYNIKKMISNFENHLSQALYVLEKNPHIQ